MSNYETNAVKYSSWCQFLYVLLIVLVHFSLCAKEIESYIISLSFTIFIVSCGLIKFMLIWNREDIMLLYNSLCLYETRYYGGLR
jgi:hypothetical protein